MKERIKKSKPTKMNQVTKKVILGQEFKTTFLKEKKLKKMVKTRITKKKVKKKTQMVKMKVKKKSQVMKNQEKERKEAYLIYFHKFQTYKNPRITINAQTAKFLLVRRNVLILKMFFIAKNAFSCMPVFNFVL